MKYDVIVVGGTYKGGRLAARLSEDPTRSILLIEAGPDHPSVDPIQMEPEFAARNPEPSPRRFDFGVVSDVEKPPSSDLAIAYFASAISRDRPAGWQEFLPGTPGDYSDWRGLGNEEWSYANVLPYISRLENDPYPRSYVAGFGRPTPTPAHQPNNLLPWQRAFHEAAVSAGYHGARRPRYFGAGLLSANISTGMWMNAASAFVDDHRHRPNLTFRSNTPVKRILFEGTRARAVEVISKGETFTVEGEQVVLCAGAVASPQILMLSGIGPATHLEEMGLQMVRDMPGVGQNLRDQHFCAVEVKTKPGLNLNPDAPSVQTGLRYTASRSDLRNGIQILPSPLPRTREEIQGAGGTIAFNCVLDQPQSFGEIRLRPDAPGETPDINYGCLADPFDLESMREAVRTCLKLLADSSFNDIVDEVISPRPEEVRSDQALDVWLRSNTVSRQSPSGTCRMGAPHDLMAVVDQRGRLRGMENLRVADTSIMPGVVRGIPDFAAIVTGERIADWIAEEEQTASSQRDRVPEDTTIDLPRRIVGPVPRPEILREPPRPTLASDPVFEPPAEDSITSEFELYVRQAGNETFTDGMDSTFANHVHESIRLHGAAAVNTWEEVLRRTGNTYETGEELLRQFGLIKDEGSHQARLQVLVKSLSNSDPRIRDAAGLGLSFLEDPSILPELQEAHSREQEEWLKDNLDLVIQQLDPSTCQNT